MTACSLTLGGCTDLIVGVLDLDVGRDAGPELPSIQDPSTFDVPLPDLPSLEGDAVEPECSRNEDCAALDDCCFEGWCYQGNCQVRYLTDCCSQPGPCASTSTLHTASCEETCVEDGCVKTLILPPEAAVEGCGDPLWRFTPGVDPFEGWFVMDQGSNDTVTWHLSPRRGLQGGWSLHAGDVLCPTYHTGPLDAGCQPFDPMIASAVSLTLDTPRFDLPEDVPAVAEVWIWAELEDIKGGAAGVFDGLEIRMTAYTLEGALAGTRTLWSSRDSPLPARQWTPVLVDLSEWDGKMVNLRFQFDTLDGVDNHHEGVFIGGVEVYTVCEGARECPPDSTCAEGQTVPLSPIKDALCVQAPPDPGQACVPCESVADCPTEDSCDVASCAEGRCVITHELTPSCCTPLDAWSVDPGFEEPVLAPSWTLAPETPETPGIGGWHLSDLRARTGAGALRFGLQDQPGLAPAGQSAAGVAWSPPFVVPPDAPSLLFFTWLSTEWDAGPSTDNPFGIDELRLEVEVVGLPLPPRVMWTSAALGGTTEGQWLPVEVALDELAGLTVRFGFAFDTGDESANEGEGVYIDDARLFRRCPDCPPGESCEPPPQEPPVTSPDEPGGGDPGSAGGGL